MVLQQRKASQKHPVKALEVKETAISGSCWNWQGPQASLPKAAETVEEHLQGVELNVSHAGGSREVAFVSWCPAAGFQCHSYF